MFGLDRKMSDDCTFIRVPFGPVSEGSVAPSAEAKSAKMVKIVNEVSKMDEPLNESIVDSKSKA